MPAPRTRVAGFSPFPSVPRIRERRLPPSMAVLGRLRDPGFPSGVLVLRIGGIEFPVKHSRPDPLVVDLVPCFVLVPGPPWLFFLVRDARQTSSLEEGIGV